MVASNHNLYGRMFLTFGSSLHRSLISGQGQKMHVLGKKKKKRKNILYTDLFSSVAQSCPTLCNPMDCSKPGLPVHQQLPEFTQIDVHCIGDAIQPSHPLSSPSPPAFQSFPVSGSFLMSWLFASGGQNIELQLQHQSLQ